MATTPGTKYLATANDEAVWGEDAQLLSITVGTAAASAVITVYDGTSTSGEVRALIDGNVVDSHPFYGSRFGRGLFVKLTGGNAKVSVTAV